KAALRQAALRRAFGPLVFKATPPRKKRARRSGLPGLGLSRHFSLFLSVTVGRAVLIAVLFALRHVAVLGHAPLTTLLTALAGGRWSVGPISVLLASLIASALSI